MKKNKNVVIYARVASQENEDIVLETQLNELRAYCKENGLIPVMTLSEAVSGNRSALHELLTLVTLPINGDEIADGLVVTDLTRISRNVTACRNFCNGLEAKGMTLHLAHRDLVIEEIQKTMKKADSQLRSQKIKQGLAKKKVRLK